MATTLNPGSLSGRPRPFLARLVDCYWVSFRTPNKVESATGNGLEAWCSSSASVLRPMRSWAGLAALLGAVSGCASAQIVEPAAELRVTKVVLYQNGVGYFERRGTITGHDLELRVRPDQINDVLKSLTVLDLSGSVASSVSLPVERSGDEAAAHLPQEVRNAKGLQTVLAVLRGAAVEVDGRDGRMAGKVVGVERGQVTGADGKLEEVLMLTLLGEDGTLTTTAVAGIRQVVIADRALAAGLQQSMDIARRDGEWKPVAVQVRMADDGSHDLLVSYIHEVPVWRPAYRAWVDGDKGITLQGWAIVDNVSGEAWKDVDLTLVVGSPLSFRYNLHAPHRVPRPDLSSRLPQVAEAPPEPDVGYESPAASIEEGELDAREEAAPRMESKKAAARPSPRPSAPSKAYGPRPAPSGGGRSAESVQQEQQLRRDAAARQAEALVVGKEVGALYAYQAQRPVTVPDRSAALINIVSRKIEGRDVFLFRDPYSNQPPFRSVLLRNGKESALEAGPITLYVEGTFAGEGFIGRVGKEETAFVPYARESGFSLVLSADQRTDELRLVRITGGRIHLQGKRVQTRTIRLESNRDQPSLAYVKLQRTAGMELVQPPKDLVKAGQDFFVPVHVPAKSLASVSLVEQSPVTMVEAGLTGPVIHALRYYLDNSKPEEVIAGPIRELLAHEEELGKISQDIQNLAQQRATLDREQQRIQGNLDSLPPGAVSAELRKKLVGQLDDASRKAAEVAKRIVEHQVRTAELQEKMRQLLGKLELK